MRYSYRAVDRSGQVTEGVLEAGSERELADVLRREEKLLLDAEATGRTSRRWSFRAFLPWIINRVALTERMMFARNLSVMIGAGLPLTRALDALEQQSTNQKFKGILKSIKESLLSGAAFAESLKAHESVFGPLFIHMVEAGEVSGKLELVLRILAHQMKRDYELRAKVRGAMFYPVIVLTALIGIGFLMMVYVVPTLTKTFSELEVELPITTRIVIAVSGFLIGYYWVVAGAIGVIIWLSIQFLRWPPGRRVFDAGVLRLPVFGPLVRKLNSARFARTLASLIASGVQITRSLEITADVLGNTGFREAIRGSVAAIQQGHPLSDSLKSRPDLFPAMVTQMLAVGEETGTSDRMLLRLALFYEEEVNQTTKNLSSVIEPMLMIVIGAVVGFFAVSMFQPLYSGSLANF